MKGLSTVKNVYEAFFPEKAKAPVVFDSPHSGRHYPDDFNFVCDFSSLRRAEDAYVDDLFDFVVKEDKVPFLKALFARSYIDVNRHAGIVDSAVAQKAKDDNQDQEIKRRHHPTGLGLIRRICSYTHPVKIYDGKLPLKDVFKRIEKYYTPYQRMVRNMIDFVRQSYTGCVFVNAHSMPSVFRDGKENPYDIVIGIKGGASCDTKFSDALKHLFEMKGYSVKIDMNGFTGGALIQKYGNPAQNEHALMVEVNRKLYMDEKTWTKSKDFDRFQKDLKDVMLGFIEYCEQAIAPNPPKVDKNYAPPPIKPRDPFGIG